MEAILYIMGKKHVPFSQDSMHRFYLKTKELRRQVAARG